ncbi:unnamed protein product [Moneuplotes crassus]|uniref:Uncharacterized protein n=2 Tax=Euplotes crassus TaxID=5936 RepID=A0AAD1XWR7_EUPCR|nr:unnamed protein product [Moneuplotes crassus]
MEDKFKIREELMGEFQSFKKPLTNAQPTSHHYDKKMKHPVEAAHENIMMKKEQKKLKEISVLYGTHMAMRIASERAIIGQGGRLVGKRSNHHLQMHMGLYDEFTPQDFLNDPYMAPELPKADPRMALEKKFGVM